MKELQLPLSDTTIKTLHAGEMVLLSGKLLTGRDQVHLRFTEALKRGKKLPVEIKGQAIYYVGPTPAKPGEVIGSCGPTTSRRMDAFSPLLIKHGLKVIIGKGGRSKEVKSALKKYKGVRVNKPLYIYNRHDKSATANKEMVEKGKQQIFARHGIIKGFKEY